MKWLINSLAENRKNYPFFQKFSDDDIEEIRWLVKYKICK